MSTRLSGRADCRTTDHTFEIDQMRAEAERIRKEFPNVYDAPLDVYYKARILQAAADLLEVHDATGISLDDWDGPRKLVETGLRAVGIHQDHLLPNGV